MSGVFNVLSTAVSLYSLLIVIRIVVTWFSKPVMNEKPLEYLSKVTDPYLNWWRKKIKFTIGVLDFSPIAAVASLSLLQLFFSHLAVHGSISIGIILAALISAAGSVVSFILWFLLVIIALRYFAHMTNRPINNNFWRIVDTISKPVISRVNNVVFQKKDVNYLTGVLVTVGALILSLIVLRFVLKFFISFFQNLPL